MGYPLIIIICGFRYKRGEYGDGENGSEISGGGERVEIAWLFVCRLLGFMWQIGEDLITTVGCVVEECWRRGLKVSEGKSKMMMLNGEEELGSEVHIDGICLEHVSEFKYLGCILDESHTDEAECSRSGYWEESGRCH